MVAVLHRVLSNAMRFAVPRHLAGEAHIDAMDPDRPVRRGRGDAMRVFQDADARDLAALVEGLARLARDILFQSHGVPHFGRPVVRSGHKEELVGRYVDRGHGSSVLHEMGDQGTFGSSRRPFSWREAGPQRFLPRYPRRDMRPKVG